MFNFHSVDRQISGIMKSKGAHALRLSLAVIFIWFGLLKPLGISPAESLVKSTVEWIPFFKPSVWVAIIGWWEVLIGITFFFKKTVRLAILLLALQMVGTFMPLLMLPEVTYQPGHIPYGLTLEGQYIIKNILIISAALVIGGKVRDDEQKKNSNHHW